VIAVILAAGRGSRMGALTATTPKPLLRLLDRPIIEHILLGLKAAGITRFVIVTGYLGEQVERHVGDGSALGIAITYRRQRQAEGTARALALARSDIGTEPFLVSWGDVVIDGAEYAHLIRAFGASPCDVMLAVNRCEDPWRGAAVYVDDSGQVTGLIEKPPRGASQTPWNNAGVFVFSPLIFTYADALPPSSRGEYELPQAIAAMIAARRVVRAHALHGFWSDLGTPEDLAAAQRSYRPLTSHP
jgi:NDP-sugar pyrophosphorylase family protein